MMRAGKDETIKLPEHMTETRRMMQAYELTFMDGHKRVVHERTYSRAIVRGGWERMKDGAEGHKQLHVVGGERRKDLDMPNKEITGKDA